MKTVNWDDCVSGKAGIAHRDMKSKNVLVKSNGVCCIADLGKLSVEQKHYTKLVYGLCILLV